MGRHTYLLAFLAMALFSAAAASAATFYNDQSGEEMWMGVKSYNSQTNEFVIGCVAPPGSPQMQSYYWTVRPDVPQAEYEITTPSNELHYTLSKAVLYHIGCQAWDGNQIHRGDFHIDRRTGPLTDGRPNVRMNSGDGLTVSLTCTPPAGVTNYNLKWTILSIHGNHELPELDNQQTVTITVPEALVWDVDCSIWDKDRSVNTQWGLPIEFYKSLYKPYVGTFTGCLTNGYCPPDTSGSTAPSCTPTTEVCDGVDNNCNGQIDENNVCSTSGGTTGTSGGTCYNSVQSIPASCSGGSISSDTFDGCRHLICSNSGSTLQALACDKSGYFELYKQSKVGTLVSQICIGSTCVGDNGYAKSSNYPICTGSTAGSNGGTTGGTTGTSGGSSTCYNAQNAPASCTSGSATQDYFDGCRHLSCASGSSNIQVLACDKSGYFEMYRQGGSGSIGACLAGTCLTNGDGYAKNTCTGADGTAGHASPQPPTWLEPNKDGVNPYDFHIQVNPMVDADGDSHVATDFEIWEGDGSQMVWSSEYNTVTKLHIHKGDGTFSGNLAGQDHLQYSHNYKVRARFYDSAGGISAWSEWRAFSTSAQAVSSGVWTTAPGYHVELVASGVSMPVNIAMAPNRYTSLPQSQQPLLYVTQLYGQIGVIRKDGSYVRYADNLLNYNSFGSLPGAGEMGVTGLYADPNSGDLYASMVYVQGNQTFGKVTRFYTNSNGDGYTSKRDILTGIEVSPSHQVQQITRGPDGKLYLNTGDADDVANVQNPSHTNGKILRFNDDGSMPSDNPWAGTYIWAMGFRNHFGGDWRPGTNELWVSHNGPDANDAIFRVTRGSIFDWRLGGDTRAGAWHLWGLTVAPTALVFNRNTAGFDTNAVYVALSGATYSPGPDSQGKRIAKLRINSDGSDGGQTDLLTYTGSGYTAPIGLAFGPDGLYFTDIYGERGFTGVGTTAGNIYRLAPGDGTNAVGGSTGFSATLSPARWYPQGTQMVWVCSAAGGSGNYHYFFEFGDGQTSPVTTSDNVYHSYPATSTYTASCTIFDDSNGQQAKTSTTINLASETTSGTGSTSGGSNGACYNSVQNVPASCAGGSITSDSWNGCRSLTCGGSSGSLSVLACDKSGYFEVYRQSSSGSAPQICLASTCLQSEGYARSGNFPVCT